MVTCFVRSSLGLAFLLFMTTQLAPLASHAAPPHLTKQGTATRLIVHDKPLLVLGGELGNSSASSAAYMEPHWSRLRQMHLNTVLAPVSWELIEPTPGSFRWESVDSLLASARAHQLNLILLWFGTWKNSMSTYVPSWVKRDASRFPRAQLPSAQSVEILSVFGAETLAADARAFAALMAHLRRVDGRHSTVIMVQVNNEIGMLPSAREHGALADQMFRSQVPDELVQRLAAEPATLEPELRRLWEARGAKRSGDWASLFGEGDAAAEVFMAWHYARFVETLVRAGKAAYPLPMFVNAAVNRANKAPGEYPSGGPVPHLMDVWKAGAPSVDLLAPDIYFPNFVDLASRYKRADNPLLIPEANYSGKAEVPANAFYAFGKLDAIGFAPFSIESIDQQQPNALGEAYAVLEQLSPAILASQGLGRMSGFRPRVREDETVIDAPVTETLGSYRFTVSFLDMWTPKEQQNTSSHGGLIIQTGAEDYLVAGRGMIVTFEAAGDGLPLAGIDSAWEGSFDARGQWIAGRLLNGDQTHQGRHLRLAPGKFQIQRVRLYRYR